MTIVRFIVILIFAGDMSHHRFLCHEKPVQLTPTRRKAKGGQEEKFFLVLAAGEFGTVPKLSIAFNSLPA